ncbi:MAG: NAD(+) synthase [Bacteroidia bacterium]|nr:NAD(+) synthase [Bacteroidia bacterium]MDW8014848.1 NAD(+) synthase [Bacteroidia bacterium]
MRVGAAAIRTTPLDWEGNRRRVMCILNQAREEGVELIVFPELVLSGYECGDFFWHPWTAQAAWESLLALIPETQGIGAVIGLPLEIGGKLYNAAAFLSDGTIVGFALKRHLPRDSVFYEPRWFYPAPQARLTEPRSGAPAGYALPFKYGDFFVTIEICEDAWQPWRPLTQHLTHIALSLNASPFEMEKTFRRHRLVTESSYRYKCIYAYANLLGNEAGKLLYDGDCAIAWEGKLIAESVRFSYGDGTLIWVEVPDEAVHAAAYRSQLPSPEGVISIPRLSSKEKKVTSVFLSSSNGRRIESRWAELTEAIAMGLWDYLWKSRSRGFVVSLSGGLDSAACAVLAKYALRKAKETLPTDLYHNRLSYMEGAEPEVYAFYQATAQSSLATYERAAAVAQSLGIPFHRWDIQPIVEAYEALVEAWMGRPLSWSQDDIARQNLQARVRVPGIWMVANLLGALLLTTSNRSELSVGYSTMDGDSSGGLAPIAGVAKADLREWALWAADALHIPPLRTIAMATPTAELRPGGQADEEDLMPYPLLNTLEVKLVREHASPAFLYEAFSEHPEWVKKFIRLFRISQWKRERAAPGFHVDAHDMDPRGAARFPLLHALQ